MIMDLEIESMKKEIDLFLEQYFDTSIGQSVYNRLQNTRDTYYDGILAIYEDLEEQGYV